MRRERYPRSGQSEVCREACGLRAALGSQLSSAYTGGRASQEGRRWGRILREGAKEHSGRCQADLEVEERVYLHDGDRGCWTHANSHKISGTDASVCCRYCCYEGVCPFTPGSLTLLPHLNQVTPWAPTHQALTFDHGACRKAAPIPSCPCVTPGYLPSPSSASLKSWARGRTDRQWERSLGSSGADSPNPSLLL